MFHIDREGRRVPGCLWQPSPAEGLAALVLISHGGSGHKLSAVVTDMVAPLLARGFAACAIDGPVHGERRSSFAEGPAVRDEFRALWAEGGSIAPMVADWRATLDLVSVQEGIDSHRIGWYGLSMGAAYGIPLLAADARIGVAVTGMWGSCRPGSAQLVVDAARIAVPTLFQQKWDDAVFTREGQLDLFDRIGTADKQLNVYPGGHTDPVGAQLDDAVNFLDRRLRAMAASRPG